MRRDKRFYMVDEDVRYYQEKFNARTSGQSLMIDPDFIAEFFNYSDYIEKEFAYRIQVSNFPKIFLTRMVDLR